LVSPGGIKKRVVEGVAEVVPGVTLWVIIFQYQIILMML
jgi:hypothetical protein